jgi:hypothetical protein
MSTGERFSITISLLTLLFLVMSALLGYIIRVTRSFTRAEDRLGDLVDDVRELIVRKDADHERIRADVGERERRGEQVHRDLGDRLTYLEQRRRGD